MPSIRRFVSISILFCLTLGTAAIAAQSDVDADVVESAGLRNLKKPESNVYSSGQPDKEQLAALSEAGVKHIVSLRTEGEIDWDEKAEVESFGMTYHSVPVAGASGINSSNAEALRGVLDSIDDESVLLHCGSGNRVGALMAVDAVEQGGADVEQAIETGKNWGLTGLESAVRANYAE